MDTPAVEEAEQEELVDVQPDELPRMLSEIGKMIRRVHNNPGQLSTTLMTKILRQAGATNDVLEYVKEFECGICERRKTHDTSRPAVAVRSTDPGMVIVVDVCPWKHPVIRTCTLLS